MEYFGKDEEGREDEEIMVLHLNFFHFFFKFPIEGKEGDKIKRLFVLYIVVCLMDV